MLSSSLHKTSSRPPSSSASPISTVLSTNLDQVEYEYQHNNTNSLRRGHTFSKLTKVSLESVPEQTIICSVPSHCSSNYGTDCQQVEMNHIQPNVCVERNEIKI